MKRFTLIGVVVAVSAALAACGTTQDAKTDGGKQSGAAITVIDADGKKIELPGPAKRIVTLEWQHTENTLALGITPVAAAQAREYNRWDTAQRLPDDVKDVGTRTEPNAEAVFAANPDLVITSGSRDGTVRKLLEDKGIKVLNTTGGDAKDPIGQMRTVLNQIAKATGTEDKAKQVLASLDQKLKQGREAISTLSLPTKKFGYVDGYLDGSNIALRAFSKGSMLGAVGNELGLENSWSGDSDPEYGLGQTDVEGLKKYGDAMLFYTSTDSEQWINPLRTNAIWNNLFAVKGKYLYAFPGGIWTFGGPSSAEQVVDAFVSTLSKQN